MAQYFALLGRKRQLSFSELEWVLKREYPKSKVLKLPQTSSAARIVSKESIDTDKLINKLGGTVKLATIQKKISTAQLKEKLFELLRNESIGKSKLIFAVSTLGKAEGLNQLQLAKSLKDNLKKEGIASRFLFPKQETQLTSAQVKLTNAIELYLIFNNGVEIAKTTALQDFEGFAFRDYKRPYADPRSGMLPLKVARMMVNLALEKKPASKSWLLDPFCGTGTIAMEALILGANIISSDYSQEKVLGTKKNLDWLREEYKFKSQYLVLESDATKIASNLEAKIDALVTEPYLGPPDLKEVNTVNIIKGLNKLYIGALRNWRAFLKKKARVVIVIPEIKTRNTRIRADLVIDRRENLGYTLVAGPLEYEREQAIVRRLIYILQAN